MRSTIKLWAGLLVLIILCPLGLYLPFWFKAESAWGEWGTEDVEKLIGYVPDKMGKLSELWKAPIPDYVFKGWEDKGMGHLSIAYILSAIFGVFLTAGIIFLIGKLLIKKE